MWIRDVDFPEAVLQAHRDGRLVFFVGAGASMDAPASLPGFAALAERIAEEAGTGISEADKKHLDVFLGRLDQEDFDVHARVKSHVDLERSQPNRLHRAIGSAAAASGPARIVTTNYDRHLSTVLSEQQLEFDEYVGPALPVGGDFEGIVYLHGSLNQPARRLVVTDEDFGHAYLLEAWAGRFLERMFSTFTVLFVGYSHNDVVMRYMSRALGPQAFRYVLTPDPNEALWHSLGVTPIKYPIENDSHKSVAEALEGWAELTSMGLLDHRQRLSEIVSAPPSQVPDEVSYLEATVSDTERVKIFCSLAQRNEWLTWISTQSVFRELIDPSAPQTDAGKTLAWWVARQFVANVEQSESALTVIHRSGGRIGSELWTAISFMIFSSSGTPNKWHAPWIALLLQNTPINPPPYLEYALQDLEWENDKSSMMLLLDHFFEPVATPRETYGFIKGAPFEVKLRGSGDHVQDAWEKRFHPHLHEIALPVLSMTDRHLRRAMHLDTSINAKERAGNWMSARRPAIESHEQNRYGEAFDVLIDAARDSIEQLWNQRHPAAAAFTQAWADSEILLLQRLALHAWALRDDIASNEKLQWLQDRQWLFTYDLRHEAYQLIAKALPTAGEVAIAGLVASVTSSPTGVEDERHSDRRRFDLLSWILNFVPENPTAKLVFETLQRTYLDWQPSPHPDFTSWMEFSTPDHQSPTTPNELHDLITDDPAKALSELASSAQDDITEASLISSGGMAVLAATVREHPMDGIAVLSLDFDAEQITRSVLSGWGQLGDVDEMTAKTIVEFINTLDLETFSAEISRVLSGSPTGDRNSSLQSAVGARELATSLWSLLPDTPLPENEDWLTVAINHPAGHLAQFWTDLTASAWEGGGENWTGIPHEIKTQLRTLISGEGANAAIAQVIIGSQVYFFFEADRAWTVEHVLPLFRWTDYPNAQRIWQAYLASGRISNALLDAGMLDLYVSSSAHFDKLSKRSQQRLLEHLAQIALNAQVHANSWLPQFVRNAADDARVGFLEKVAFQLEKMPPEVVEQQWNAWMASHWRSRVDGIPRRLTVPEASALAEWSIYLTTSLDEGVHLATQHTAGFLSLRNGIHDVMDRVTAQNARTYAHLVAHLLAGTPTRERPAWELSKLNELVAQVRDHADHQDLFRIAEEGLRLQLPNAHSWAPGIDATVEKSSELDSGSG